MGRGKRRSSRKGSRGRRGSRGGGGGDEGVIVYGYHAVEELLEEPAVTIRRMLVSDRREERLEPLLASASRRGLSVEELRADRMDTLARGGNHQGLALEVDPPAYRSLQEVLGGLGEGPSIVLALDELQDAGNVGAILRSAAAFGVDAVLLPRRRAVGLSPGVIRASSGYAWRTPVVQLGNLSQSFDTLREAGFWVLGTVVEGGQDIGEVELPGERLVIVLGSEHKGMRRLVGERCDMSLRLRTAPGVESLNVSSAAAIFLFELRRRLSWE